MEAGRTRAKNPHAAVRSAISYHLEFIEALDGRWYSVADQLDGAVFTVRLTMFERREEIVLVREELGPGGAPHAPTAPGGAPGRIHLDYLGDYFDLPFVEDWDDDAVDLRAALDDETADTLLGLLDELGLPPGDEEERLRDLVWETRFTQVLHGPPGWLPVLGTRQLLGITVTGGVDRGDRAGPARGHGRARGCRGDPRGPARTAGDRSRPQLVRAAGRRPGRAPRARRDGGCGRVSTATAAVRELVRRGGLEVEDGLVGHPGTDWDQVRWAESPDPEDAWGFEPPDVVH